jgi:hypothetical protein
VPPSSVKQAAALYTDFTGHDAEYFDSVPIEWMKTGLTIGHCDGVMYETVRDGVKEHYCHKFKKSARPLLVASHDGEQLALIGGNFTFTERGIVDN